MTRVAFIVVCAGMVLLLISLLPLTNDVSEQSTSQLSQANYGRMLFTAKGCASCHQHDAVTRHWDVSFGPNLTHYPGDAAYLRAWLKNPKAVWSDAQMPDLNLSDEEIDALIVFLQTSAQS